MRSISSAMASKLSVPSSVARMTLVLMDVQMPEMDGVTATLRIRDMDGPKSQIPIIALTANAMKGDEKRYRAAGMNDYVSKPIESEKLTSAIYRQTGVLAPIAKPGKAPAALIQEPEAPDTALQTDLDRLLGYRY